jgi:hypothetical protein
MSEYYIVSAKVQFRIKAKSSQEAIEKVGEDIRRGKGFILFSAEKEKQVKAPEVPPINFLQPLPPSRFMPRDFYLKNLSLGGY